MNYGAGEESRQSILTDEDVYEIRRLYSLVPASTPRGVAYEAIARLFPVTPIYVGQIVNRRKWKHLKDPKQ